MTMIKVAVAVMAMSLSCSVVSAQTSSAAQPTAPLPISATDSDPIAHYRVYTAAIDKGEYVAAATAAHLAWQTGERVWNGNNPNLPGLAYNAAWSAALVGKSSERLDAARRAVELAPQATQSYTLPEAEFLLAYGEFFATPAGNRASKAGKLAAAALPVEATWPDFLLVNALSNAAVFGASRGRSAETIQVADRALAAINRISPEDSTSRALALFARAQGRLWRRTEPDEAVADLIEARVSYGPMRGGGDKTWGALAAWEMAARSVVLTNNAFPEPNFSRIPAPGARMVPTTRRTNRPLKMTEAQNALVEGDATNIGFDQRQCDGIKRIRRIGRDISHPTGEAQALNIAGVVVLVDFDGQGRVLNPRVAGAVPEGPFGDSALAAIRGWMYDIPTGAPEPCLKNYNISISFAIG